MNAARETVLVLEGDEVSRRDLLGLLEDAGYDASSPDTCEGGLRAAREKGADLLLLDEQFSGLECGDLLAEFKGASATADIRVILLSSGAAGARVRGLDLGADDVVTRPWESTELLARVRTQLRAKKAQDELLTRLRIAEQGQEMSRTAFEALAVTEKMTRDAFWLGRGLKIGLGILFVAVALMAGIYFRFSRRATTETQRSYALISRLNRNLASQEELVERARKLSEQMQAYARSSADAQKQQLQKQSEELRAQMAQASLDQAGALRGKLAQTQQRLRQVESESSRAEGIIRTYAPSVCLIHVAVALHDEASGRPLRYFGLTSDGEPIQDAKGNPEITLGGTGPELRAEALGTAFLVGQDGQLLTNHHVVEPWWHSEEFGDLKEQGVRPVIVEMTAYFPGSSNPYPVTTERISSEADVALVRASLGGLKREVLRLDGSKGAAVNGEPIVLMGYATGLDAVLARADESTVRSIVNSSDGDPEKILESLAQKNLIRPLITQGHLGDVFLDKIVYDAQTTSGGSGGPVFNSEGKVIGINYAILEGFGGSNFGIPAQFAERLLKAAR
jgi:DNA-binding response OmpR family regulator